MDSRSVVLGSSKNGKLRITFQDSQKSNRYKELVFKEGKNHKFSITGVDSLKRAISISARKAAGDVGFSEIYSAVQLFNNFYGENISAENIAESLMG